MNDKTLLELAAKAAGYTDLKYWSEERQCLTDKEGWDWNSITSDGDAMRLAVKLDISIDFVDKCAWKRHQGKLIQEYWGGDYDPSYKHAIVRVAAAIAEQGDKV